MSGWSGSASPCPAVDEAGRMGPTGAPGSSDTPGALEACADRSCPRGPRARPVLPPRTGLPAARRGGSVATVTVGGSMVLNLAFHVR